MLRAAGRAPRTRLLSVWALLGLAACTRDHASTDSEAGTPIADASEASDAPSPISSDGQASDGSDAATPAPPVAPCIPAPQVYGNLRTVWSLALGAGTLAGTAVDPANDIVVAGSTSEPLTVGSATVAAPPIREPFVVRLDPAGNLLSSWALPGAAEALAMGVDGQGNVYLAGSFNGTPDFGNGPLSGSLFLVKVDPTGKALWSHGYPAYEPINGGNGGLVGAKPSMAVDAAGDVALAGIWLFPVDFGGGYPDAGTVNNGFVVEFDPAGNYRFSHGLNDYNDSASAGANIQFDAQGNLAIVGSSSGDLGLGNAPSTDSRTAFAAKLDPAGNVLWLTKDGAFDTATAVAAGASTTYFTGNFAGQFGITSPVLAHGISDTFVAGFDGTGRPTFETSLLSSAQFSAVAADPSGGVVAIGSMDGIGSTSDRPTSCIGDLGGGPLSGPGIVLAKYGDGGHGVFSARFATVRSPLPGQSVAFDAAGAIVASGEFEQTIDLGTGMLAAGPSTSEDGTIFVAKYVEQPPTPSPNPAISCPPIVDGTLPGTGSAGVGSLLALSSDTLYWSTGGEVMAAPFDGGPPVAIAIDQKSVVALATDTGSLYWANAGTFYDPGAGLGPGSDGQIMAAPFDGGPVTMLASGLPAPHALTVDETGIYWTGGGSSSPIGDGGSAPGVLMGIPRDGGAASVLLSGLANPLALAARSGVIVFTTDDGNTVARTTSAGDPPVTLAPLNGRTTSSIALDATNAYLWVDSTSNGESATGGAEVRSAPLTGGAATTIFSTGSSFGTLAISGSQLFIGMTGASLSSEPGNNGGVYSLDTGGNPGSLVTVLGGPSVSSFAVDDKHLAWVEYCYGFCGISAQGR